MCALIVRPLPDTARWTFTRFLSGNFISLDHKEQFPPKGNCHFIHSRPRSSLVSPTLDRHFSRSDLNSTASRMRNMNIDLDRLVAQLDGVLLFARRSTAVTSSARRARLCTVVLLRFKTVQRTLPVFLVVVRATITRETIRYRQSMHPVNARRFSR